MNDNCLHSIPGFSDPFSSITHLLGAGVYLLLSVRMLCRRQGQVWAFAIFAFSCVFMLSMSGVYHLLGSGTGRAVLQRLDHAAIFVLIAGTMTPIHAVLFDGFMRWDWLLLVWSVVVTTITLKTIFFTAVPEWLGLTFFLGLGWLGAITAGLLWYRLGITYAKPILYGGVAYSIGAMLEFLGQPVLIPGGIGPHELFHITVLVGITCHWRFVASLATDQHLTVPNNALSV